MKTRKNELEQFLIKELSKGDMTYKQIQVIDYDTNIEEVAEYKYAHITINILDDWDYRQLCEVSFANGELNYVSGEVSGQALRLLQRWVRQEKESQTRIEELGLSVRPYRSLIRAGINTVEQLEKVNDTKLLRIRNFGRKSLDEVKCKLAEMKGELI